MPPRSADFVSTTRTSADDFQKRIFRTVTLSKSQSTPSLQMYESDPSNGDYSREIRLREEVESPFRKVRFFVYAACLAGAFTSLAVSTARVANFLLSGSNGDLLQESATNAAVDLLAISVLGFLFKRDLDAQESRLKRAAKGAEFARLMIRGSSSLLGEVASEPSASVKALSGNNPTSVATQLSSLRRGRGVEKRVVIAAAGKDKIREVLQSARYLCDALMENDLVVVPVVLPQCTAPLGIDKDLIELDCVALPAGGGNWKTVLEDEMLQAKKQGVDVESDGFCVVVKKNGRVGQRTKGVYLDRFVGEVIQRKEMGLDVNNI